MASTLSRALETVDQIERVMRGDALPSFTLTEQLLAIRALIRTAQIYLRSLDDDVAHQLMEHTNPNDDAARTLASPQQSHRDTLEL